jgi:enamine deaminase RidA (YjgF/YER057c/UK114 family)
MAKDVIFTDRLMRPIAHFSHASRVGNLLHIGAVAGVFPDLRLAGDSPGRIDTVAQAERMFDNLETTLGLMSGKLEDVVRIKAYLAFPRDIEKYRTVFAARLGKVKPAHTVVTSWDFPLPQAALELDAVALVDAEAKPLSAEGIFGRAGEAPAGVLCDDIHHANVLPLDADGRTVGQSADVQAAAGLQNLAKMLAAAQFKPADVCSLHLTLADMRDVAAAEAELQRFFGDSVPTCTIVGAALDQPDIRITIESVAVRGGGRAIGTRNLPVTKGRAAPAVVAGEMLFVGGRTGVSAGARVEQQTRAAWAQVNELIDAAGFSPDDIVRTNNVLIDWRDYAGFNAGYGANVAEPYVPRATVLGQLSDPRARMQVEAVAHRQGRGATILQVPPIISR